MQIDGEHTHALIEFARPLHSLVSAEKSLIKQQTSTIHHAQRKVPAALKNGRLTGIGSLKTFPCYSNKTLIEPGLKCDPSLCVNFASAEFYT